MPGASVDVSTTPITYTFSQSWLGTYLRCPELARRELLGLSPDVETDAAAVGTAVHAAIEACLTEGVDFDGMVDVWEDTFYPLTEKETFAWKKYHVRSAREMGITFIHKWCEWYDTAEDVPDPGRDLFEHSFSVPLHGDEERKIVLKGTMDVCDPTKATYAALDFKTSGRYSPTPYDEKLYGNSAIQPTAYTFAHSVLYPQPTKRKLDFRYVVMTKLGVQDFTVQRGPKDWSWLTERCVDATHLIEADLPSWPKLGDVAEASPLCSKKWCPSFADCKGRH